MYVCMYVCILYNINMLPKFLSCQVSTYVVVFAPVFKSRYCRSKKLKTPATRIRPTEIGRTLQDFSHKEDPSLATLYVHAYMYSIDIYTHSYTRVL